jgi:hypothetical protein
MITIFQLLKFKIMQTQYYFNDTLSTSPHVFEDYH